MERIAIVTGAGNGIGEATARRFAADGISVAVVDIDESRADAVAREINEAGGKALGVRCDVSKADQVEACIAKVEEAWGTPTILVNNAGIGGPFHRLDEVSTISLDIP